MKVETKLQKIYTAVRHAVAFASVAVVSVFAGTVAYADYTGPEGIQVATEQPDGTPIHVRAYGDEFFNYRATPEGYTVMIDPATNIWYYTQRNATTGEVERSSLVVGKDVPPSTLCKKILPPEEKIRTMITQRRAELFDGDHVFKRERIERMIKQGASKSHINALIKDFNKKYAETGKTTAISYVSEDTTNGDAPKANANGTLMAPPAPFAGTVVGLVVLVDFADEVGRVTQESLANLFNQEGYSANGNSGSVRDYYTAQSVGKVNFTNQVTRYYRMPTRKADYLANANGSRQLVTDVLAALRADNSLNMDAVTENGTRGIALSIMYAGGSPAQWAGPLWPHASLGGLAGEGAVHGKTLWGYQMTSIGTTPVIGTICHELGHLVFGFADYYSYFPADGQAGIGANCLMCAGSHANGGRTPTQLQGYLRMSLGWISSQGLKEGIMPVDPNATLYKFTRPGVETEYFLIEGRKKNNGNIWQNFLPSEGIVIWHVDETRDGNFNNDGTGDFEVLMYQAGQEISIFRTGAAGDYFGNGTATEFTRNSVPSSDWLGAALLDAGDDAPSGLSITEVSSPGAEMSFRCGPLSPKMEVSPVRILHGGLDEGTAIFTIANVGVGGLDWSAVETEDWMDLTPVDEDGVVGGSLDSGEEFTVTVNFRTKNLTMYDRQGVITISSPTTGVGTQVVDVIHQAGIAQILTLETVSWRAISAGAEKQVRIRSNRTWVASSSASWLRLMNSSGDGDGEIKFSVDKNESVVPRFAKVIVTAGSIVREIDVEQLQASDVLVLDTIEWNAENIEGTKSVGVISNRAWNVTTSASWLHTSTTSGANSSTIAVRVDANLTDKERVGTVLFTAGTVKQTLLVSQAGVDVVDTLTLSTSMCQLGAAAGSSKFTLTSSVPWKLENSAQDWLKVTPTSGGAGTFDIVVEAGPNLNQLKRDTSLLFAAGQVKKSVRVSQLGTAGEVKNPVLDKNPDSLHGGWVVFDDNPTIRDWYRFGVDGGSSADIDPITLPDGIDTEIHPYFMDQDWLIGYINNDGELVLEAKKNDYGEVRETYVIFQAEDGIWAFFVTQEK